MTESIGRAGEMQASAPPFERMRMHMHMVPHVQQMRSRVESLEKLSVSLQCLRSHCA